MELAKTSDHISVSLIQPGRQGMKETVDKGAYPKDQEIAKAILYCATHQKKEIYIGSQSKLSNLLNGFGPLITRMMDGTPDNTARKSGELRSTPGEGLSRTPDPIVQDGARKTSKYPFFSTIVFAGIGAGLWLFSRKKKEDQSAAP